MMMRAMMTRATMIMMVVVASSVMMLATGETSNDLSIYDLRKSIADLQSFADELSVSASDIKNTFRAGEALYTRLAGTSVPNIQKRQDSLGETINKLYKQLEDLQHKVSHIHMLSVEASSLETQNELRLQNDLTPLVTSIINRDTQQDTDIGGNKVALGVLNSNTLGSLGTVAASASASLNDLTAGVSDLVLFERKRTCDYGVLSLRLPGSAAVDLNPQPPVPAVVVSVTGFKALNHLPPPFPGYPHDSYTDSLGFNVTVSDVTASSFNVTVTNTEDLGVDVRVVYLAWQACRDLDQETPSFD